MKNTLIPLDIVWIDKNEEVVFIAENVLPCVTEICESYSPDKEALYVLELNSGIVKEIGLKGEDMVKLKN